MIIAHNDSMYGIAEIQVDNIWDIDRERSDLISLRDCDIFP